MGFGATQDQSDLNADCIKCAPDLGVQLPYTKCLGTTGHFEIAILKRTLEINIEHSG